MAVDIKSSEELYKVIIRSLGTTTPASAAAIAKGLNVSVQQITSIIYRAPSVLIDQVSFKLAEQMHTLLETLGYEAEVVSQDVTLNRSNEHLDISVYVRNVDRFNEIVDIISSFIGAPTKKISEVLMTPPGVVMGGVTQATANALQEKLGELANVRASDPEKARYDLYLNPGNFRQTNQILDDVRSKGIEPIADTGCIAEDIEHKIAKPIWQRHAKSGLLFLINRDFLRFDMVLPQNGNANLSPEQTEYLISEVGIEAQHHKAVMEHRPVTLFDALPFDEIEASLLRAKDAGFDLEADMVTFKHFAITLNATNHLTKTTDALAALNLLSEGESVPTLPFTLPHRFSETSARIYQSSLEAVGLDVELSDNWGEV